MSEQKVMTVEEAVSAAISKWSEDESQVLEDVIAAELSAPLARVRGAIVDASWHLACSKGYPKSECRTFDWLADSLVLLSKVTK